MLRDRHWSYFEAYAQAWNDQDLPRVMAQFAEGGLYDDPIIEEPSTGADIRAYFRRTLEGFPDLRFEGQVHESQEDPVLINQWTGTATHSGNYFGLPPTGQSVRAEGVSMMTFSDEGISRVQSYFDRRAIMAQLGLTFPAVFRRLPQLLYWRLTRGR